ncbi:UPF0182 family protein [Clostridium bowmanii]|uniref:UPF0182 family protein n=1 Tax=Clostridium bowmanii TaxID=132925 RepID=UPI001C0D5BA4|nr:UPF0182 family protein [Clostridium bowmanii]MBU3191140.1 UPF0182 family protein [Clostridium bowmanii]MCA1075531.1 UPF0182 family protein [Clostridium bowmanii]
MKKKLVISTVFIILIVCLLFTGNIVQFIINIEWFDQVGYLSIYLTKIITVSKFMIPLFIISYLGIWLYYKSIRKSIMHLKIVVEVNAKKRAIENKIFIACNLIFSFIFSFSFASAYWSRLLQFINSVSFNEKDPIFNIDVSFYIFKLPLIESLYTVIMTLLVLLVIVKVVVFFIIKSKDFSYVGKIPSPFGDIKQLGKELIVFSGRQIAIISALIALFLSLGFLINSLNLVYSPRGVAYGASYTDIHVTLLFYKILIVASILSAVVIFISVLKSKVKPIIISIAAIVLISVVEVISAAVVQSSIVKPNEKEFEKTYIQNNINFTRKAFNIADITTKTFNVKNDLKQEDISNNRQTIDNIRINSAAQALEFYNQVQILRYYYNFSDIDVDRYKLNDKYSQVFLAAREIDSKSLTPSTWQNTHMIYTHGFGVVMSKVNVVNSEGQPDFVIKDMPIANSTNIKLINPRIYFGEQTSEYALVNTNVSEFDYPQGGVNKVTNYAGKAGIKMSFGNKLLFAINNGELNFLLSRDIKSTSKILINRNIVERAKKIAPFLTYDKDPYVVISGEKLYYIIDAYTTSTKYPYSQPENGINYIRNSVKVVIDAYDGTTNFYKSDSTDPIVQSYAKMYPKLFKNISEVSDDLKAHFRYPADIFSIQSTVLGKYHVTDPGVFYNGEDIWDVSKNANAVGGEVKTTIPPYIVEKLPGTNSEEMVLQQYFNIKGKYNMTAILGARMDGENYGKLFLNKFPAETTVYSPYLFKQRISQDTTISAQLSLWNTGGSQVQYGDTVILPIKNSLLYIEPLYLRASGKNSIPEMKKIIISYDNKLLMVDNIESGLQQIFNYQAPNVVIPGKSEITTTPLSETKIKLIKQANDLYTKALDAQKALDWTKYGEYIKQLGTILQQLDK